MDRSRRRNLARYLNFCTHLRFLLVLGPRRPILDRLKIYTPVLADFSIFTSKIVVNAEFFTKIDLTAPGKIANGTFNGSNSFIGSISNFYFLFCVGLFEKVIYVLRNQRFSVFTYVSHLLILADFQFLGGYIYFTKTGNYDFEVSRGS